MSKEDKSEKTFVFGKINFILMLSGLALMALGYILMIGGGSDDPNVFNEAIFNTQRLTVSPILILLGIVVEIFAIMHKQKKNNTISENTDTESK